MLWKSFADQAAMATGNFARLFGKLDVPPLSPVAARVLELSREPEIEIADLSKVIASDPGISAKILTTVNSAYFGLSQPVADTQHAITLLGIKRVTSLVLAFSTAQVLPTKVAGFDPVEFWQDSLQRAVFASALCSRIARGSEGEAFTGGLLQNIALPILLVQWSEYYLPVINMARETQRNLDHVEDEQLSWNHAQAGAWMAGNWRFPDVLVCCIGLHHSTVEQLEALGIAKTPAAAVAVSSRLPAAEQVCCSELQLPDRVYAELCRETDVACGELASLFNVAPAKPLAASSAPPGSP